MAIVLLLIPFFVLNTNLKHPSRVNRLDQFILKVSAPVQYVVALAAGSFSHIWENYLYLIEVKRDSDLLSQENRRLRYENAQLWVSYQENARLRSLLNLKARLPLESVSAKVINKEISPYFRVIRVRLDRGLEDRIRPGMPVLSAGGLVGEVRRSFGAFSDIVLTADRTSAVDIHIPRSGARGILRGVGSSRRYTCRIQYLLRTDDVRVGDKVYTSGWGYKFPAGIWVGTITKMTKKAYGLYQEAEVSPAVNFAQLEEVLVLLSSGARPLVEDSDGQH